VHAIGSARVLRAGPLTVIALILLSCTASDVGKQRQALPAQVPEVPDGREMAAAHEAFGREEFGVAGRYYQMARASEPDSLDACLGLAASYDWLNRFDLADPVYSSCKKIADDSFLYHNNVGFSHLLRGDLDRASVSLAQAAALRPGHPVVENNLAILRDASNG